ncbi:MAG: DNA methyltransferase [Verrucomicrobiota bacterium]
MSDFVLWYSKNQELAKSKPPRYRKDFVLGEGNAKWLLFEGGFSRGITASEIRTEISIPESTRPYAPDNLISQGRAKEPQPFEFQGTTYDSWEKNSHWKASHPVGMTRLGQSGRIHVAENSIRYIRLHEDFDAGVHGNIWADTGSGNFTDDKIYVVQTNAKVIERCLLMATDPGDLVLDPTCGSGTTATVAEQWGRRWITFDTSRVALALARARIMGARYPYYLLADSKEGQEKEAELTRRAPSTQPTYGNLRHGFVYERVPHITLKSIANKAEIDIIWENFEETLAPLRAEITKHLPNDWLADYRAAQSYDVEIPDEGQEWELPRHPETAWPEDCIKAFGSIQNQLAKATNGSNPNQSLINRNLQLINTALERDYSLITDDESLTTDLPERAADPWTDEKLIELHAEFWDRRIARQQEIDASIAAKADHEYLYDKPYENKKAVRVAGPFTVESLSPHRTLALDEDDNFIEPTMVKENAIEYASQSFEHLILDNLRTAGVQQMKKNDRIRFESLRPWPGYQICAEGYYREGDDDDAPRKRAGIVIGPEFGSLRREDLSEAAREAGEAGFDVVIATAFSYDSHASDFDRLGRIPVLKARMNADLHMAGDLKNTNTANLFVIFGEPDIEVTENGEGQLQVTIHGIDVFDPKEGEVRSDDTDGIACWMIDTDYNGESFFVRHAYFLGQNDPYKSLKTTLKAEIDKEAWDSLNSATSRPFDKPNTGRIAVKAINHLGDEVMKVFRLKK